MENITTVGESSQAAGSPVRDFYSILNVSRTATEDNIGKAYNEQYNKIAGELCGDPKAEFSLNELDEAFRVLSDPEKRKQYDSLLHQGKAENSKSAFAGIGRAFGAIISRLPKPLGAQGVPPELPSEVTENADLMCQQGGIEGSGPPMDPRVTDLQFGSNMEGKVEKGSASFYRLSVENQHMESGFFLVCKSANKDKFKLAVFDSKGVLLHMEPSIKSFDRTHTQATLFFTTFETYSFATGKAVAGTVVSAASPRAPSPLSPVQVQAQNQQIPSAGSDFVSVAPGASPILLPTKSLLESDTPKLPSLFGKLDTFSTCNKSIDQGRYLVAVVGDNFIGKSSFFLHAATAVKDASEVHIMMDVDNSLIGLKCEIDKLKMEYIHAKAAYESAMEKVYQKSSKLDLLLDTRDKAYQAFIDCSIGIPSVSHTSGGSGGAPSVPTTTASIEAAAGAADAVLSASGEGETDIPSGKKERSSSMTENAVGDAAAVLRSGPAVMATALSSGANKAAAAGGWLAKKISVGVSQLGHISVFQKDKEGQEGKERSASSPSPSPEESQSASASASTSAQQGSERGSERGRSCEGADDIGRDLGMSGAAAEAEAETEPVPVFLPPSVSKPQSTPVSSTPIAPLSSTMSSSTTADASVSVSKGEEGGSGDGGGEDDISTNNPFA